MNGRSATEERIAEEWRREEPGGSIFSQMHKTKNGIEKRWHVEFYAKDYLGKRRKYSDSRSTTKKQAQRALIKQKERALASKRPPLPKALEPKTLADYLDEWHKQRIESGHIRPNTADDEERYVGLWKELIGSLFLRDITPEDVRTALRSLQTERLKGKRRAIQMAFRCLRKALADVDPRLPLNPCDGVERPTVTKSDTKTFTPEELKKIIEAADKPLPDNTVVDETFSALVYFLANTGCRIGEALGLTWGDVDLENNQVHIRKALTLIKGMGPRRTEPKTKSAIRTIPLSAAATAKLHALRRMVGAIPHGTAFVFESERGGPLHDSNIARRQWHPLLLSLKLEKCGFHRFRHTYASLVLRAGLDIVTVSRILGHANPSITLGVYGHFLPGREKEAAAAIAAVMDGNIRG